MRRTQRWRLQESRLTPEETAVLSFERAMENSDCDWDGCSIEGVGAEGTVYGGAEARDNEGRLNDTTDGGQQCAL